VDLLSTGIEELVSMDMTVPPGSNDTIIAMAMDTTGFSIPNPDNFSAVQIPLQQEIISQGTSVAYAPTRRVISLSLRATCIPTEPTTRGIRRTEASRGRGSGRRSDTVAVPVCATFPRG
jgi:hypothetical protein